VPDFYPLDERIERMSLAKSLEQARRSRAGTVRRILGSMFMLRRIVANKKPDAVLSFIDVSNVLTILSTVGTGVRVVVAERTNPSQNHTISGFWKLLRRLSYRWAEAVVAQTSDAARWLDAQCGIRSLIIPNAIREMPKIGAVRAPFILAVGRLTREKGIDSLLRAFAMISGDISDWRVVIAGDGPERSALMGLRDQLHLTERVDFVGQIDNVEQWLARAGLFVHASLREGFPNVVLEAMAMGAPTVCTDCKSGPADIIRDGVNGRLIAVNDVSALARTIKELIENPQLRLQYGLEALKVMDSFNQDMIMERWSAALVGARGL
jgi:glycosyltransferase involved in cell wall biosynthesis